MKSTITLKSNDLRETSVLTENLYYAGLPINNDEEMLQEAVEVEYTHGYSDVWVWVITGSEDDVEDAVYDLKNMIQEATSGYDVTVTTK